MPNPSLVKQLHNLATSHEANADKWSGRDNEVSDFNYGLAEAYDVASKLLEQALKTLTIFENNYGLMRVDKTGETGTYLGRYEVEKILGAIK